MKKFNQARVNGGSNYDSLKVAQAAIHTYTMSNSESKPKRDSASIRANHIAKGATLLAIKYAVQVAPRGDAIGNPDLRSTSRNSKGKLLHGNSQAASNNYLNMERKGFRITSDTGCMIPDDGYCTHADKDSFKAYQKSWFCAHGFLPKQKVDLKDDRGRELVAQLSHLCHRRWCCRVDHLVFEYRWRNVDRNSCLGPINETVCGCLLQYQQFGTDTIHGPCCIRGFSTSSAAPPSDLPLCDSNEAVKKVLTDTGFPYPYSFVADYATRDYKAAKRKERPSYPPVLSRKAPLAKVPEDEPLNDEVSPIVKKRRLQGTLCQLWSASYPELDYDKDPAKLAMLEDVPDSGDDVED